MPRYDFRSPRLFVADALQAGGSLTLAKPQAHYLRHVLRLAAGESVLVFNGRDGEWQGVLVEGGKRAAQLRLQGQTRPQTQAADLHLLFAPLKHARLDYMVQKAVELGVSRLQPVMTRHTQAARVNEERMLANAIEAAEQCGILTLPDIGAPVAFARMLAGDETRHFIFCDEDAEVQDPVAALSQIRDARGDAVPLSVLIGPEGGFSEEERAALLRRPHVTRLALGPRILRADTAAVAALTLAQAVLGDWR